METNNKFFTAAEIFVRLLSSFPKKASEISKINVMRWCSEVVTEYLTDPVGMIAHYKYQLGIQKLISGVTKVSLLSMTIEPVSNVINSKYYNSDTKLIYQLIDTGGGDLQWDLSYAPTVGTKYLFENIYYDWNGSSFKVCEYTIRDGKVELPTDVFKLEAVYDQNNQLIKDCVNQGQYVHFSTLHMPTQVYIDYYSIPADEDGFPLIKRGYEAACYAYCVYKMFEEDASVIPPRIQQWRWLQIVDDKEHELGAARSSWSDLTDNDIRDIHEFIIDPNYKRFITKDFRSVVSKSDINSNSNIE